MGYYVVGEPIPLPIEAVPEYLNFFPKEEKCLYFKSKEKAIAWAKFQNKVLEGKACPIFEMVSIQGEQEKVNLDLEGESLKARKGTVKKWKNISSGSLEYLGANPE